MSVGNREFSTPCINGTCSPVWDGDNRYQWCVDIPKLEKIKIEVFDKDTLSGSDKIGHAEVVVQDLIEVGHADVCGCMIEVGNDKIGHADVVVQDLIEVGWGQEEHFLLVARFLLVVGFLFCWG